MTCTGCGSERTRVIDSRKGGDSVRRRRQCSECSNRFTTYEIPFQSLKRLRDGRAAMDYLAKVMAAGEGQGG